jgi:hydroxypyruvate reductase
MTVNASANLRRDVEKLVHAALRAADPRQAIRRHVRRDGESLCVDEARYDLRDRDIRLIAVGKAAAPMADEVIGLLGDRLTSGVVVTKYGHAAFGLNSKLNTQHLALIEAGHPIPDENSWRAGQLVCDSLKDCTERTLVTVCVSGGASALMVAPHDGISLNSIKAINEALLRSGADIHEMNAVRSRLDRLKGGGLIRLAQPAQVIGLILSDVIGDPLDVIASGLTNDPRARNVLVGNNTQACEAVAAAARVLGYDARIVTTELRGEAREAGADIARQLSILGSGRADEHAGCLIYGGETTVTLRGEGKGGRNQELALAAALELDDLKTSWVSETPEVLIAALGTDGTDGPTDAAGAIATNDTMQRARALGLDVHGYLDRNDSYHFFNALRDLIVTGPTGTNVADVVIALSSAC